MRDTLKSCCTKSIALFLHTNTNCGFRSMCTDARVAGKKVLAVVLTDIQSSLEFTVPDVRKAIVKGKLGYVQVTKDFLSPGFNDMMVHRQGKSKCRKYDAVVLETLDADTAAQLKSSKSVAIFFVMDGALTACISYTLSNVIVCMCDYIDRT